MSIDAEIPDILDVTLRDGSYLVDFQFTAEDTAMIASALDSAGFRWIEVGHGLGLNASASGKRAAATDEEYMEAAAGAINNARWGMFFVPGIGREEDLRLAARYGMDFVRIGTNVTEIAQARPYIALAKELGFIVSYNAMKSYAVAPAEFARCAAETWSWGADVVCLVDSAGGMLPDEVGTYLQAAKGASDAHLGFHGHDNLSLAMANTLRAVEFGAALVDSSLQGVGRSAGNTITEVLVAVLHKRGLLATIDLNTVTDLSQTLIQPTLRRRGMDAMAIIAGSARFHSAFTPKVQDYANRYGLDVRDLIVRLCQEDQINAPDALLDSLSRELVAERLPRTVTIRALERHRPKPERSLDALAALVRAMRSLAAKTGKSSALNIVVSEEAREEFSVSGNIHSSLAYIVGSVALSTETQLEAVLDSVDGSVDVVFLDADRKPHGPTTLATTARRRLKESQLLTYSDSQLWVEAIEGQVARLLGEALDRVTVVVVGNHPKSRLLVSHLANRGARVGFLAGSHEPSPGPSIEAMSCLSDDPKHMDVSAHVLGTEDAALKLRDAQLVVVWTMHPLRFGRDEVRQMKAGAYVLDASIGAVLPDALEEAQRCGVLPLRVNIWPALIGAILAAHESARIGQECFGWETTDGVPIVAGGAIGQEGDVIVDSVRHPTRVIGICDGRGGVRFGYDDKEAVRVKQVSEQILLGMVTPQVGEG